MCCKGLSLEKQKSQSRRDRVHPGVFSFHFRLHCLQLTSTQSTDLTIMCCWRESTLSLDEQYSNKCCTSLGKKKRRKKENNNSLGNEVFCAFFFFEIDVIAFQSQRVSTKSCKTTAKIYTWTDVRLLEDLSRTDGGILIE